MRHNLQVFTRIILAVLLCFLLSPVVKAQSLASLHNGNTVSTTDDPRQNKQLRSLKSVLQELGAKHQVHFNYDPQVVKDKMVEVNTEELNTQELEQLLTSFLAQFELTHEKLREDYYIIYDDKERNVTKVKKQSLNLPSTERKSEKILDLMQQLSPQFHALHDKTITGKVTDDAEGTGLPGVNIVVKNTTVGTVTDVDGNYRISVPDDTEVLVFSSVGYTTEEIEIADRSVIDVALVPDIKALSEVVVVGFGTQKKVNVTGAVAMVEGEDIMNMPATGTVDALQGVLPGTTITRTSGSPGEEGFDIQIRGMTSVNNNPVLVLINGVEGKLESVRPEDIESISVLKDAAAASIYGAKAAGGVVLVTTKRGEPGKVTVSYNSYYSIAKMGRTPERLSSYEWAQMRNLAMVNAGNSPVLNDEELGYLTDPNYLHDLDPANPNRWRYWGDYDYVDMTTKDFTTQQSHNISISGGSENTTYRLSGTYYKNGGMLKIGPDNNERYTGRLTLDSEIGKYLKLSNDIAYARNMIQKPAGGSQLEGQYGYLSNIFTYPGVTPLYDPNGHWAFGARVGGYDGRSKIPFASHDAGLFERAQNNLRLNSVLTINNLVKNLQFRLVGVMDADFDQTKDRHKPIYEYGVDETILGNIYSESRVEKAQRNSVFKEFQFLADYDVNINNHTIHLLGGYSAQDFRSESFNAQASELVNGDLPDFNWASNEGIVLGDEVITNIFQSVFGRINYSFKDRYLFEANVRYDGSSKLSPENRYQLFPSASVGWRLSEEPWFNIGFISELKLRGSWGQLGNAGVLGNYDYIPLLIVGDDLILSSAEQRAQYVYQNTLASEHLTWETVQTSNIGIDLGLFEDKLTITGDYFVKRNKDMLARVAYPSVIGVGVPNQNVGEMKTWGWEASVLWRQNTGKFNYWVNANIADAQNELVEYLGADVIGEGTTRLLNGKPINSIYGYQTDGFFQSQEAADEHAFQDSRTGPGDVKYLDLDGDGSITPGRQTVEDHGDLVYLGNTNPRYTFGLQSGFQWGGFDFTVFFQGVGKRTFLMDQFSLMPFFRDWLGPQKQHLDYWTEANPDAFWPRPYSRGDHNFRASDKWIQNAAYVRLKNIQLGYTIPQSLVSRIGIEKLYVYLSGRDIWEVTKTFDYIDPELPDNATYQYPFRRRYTIGLNLTF